MRANLYHNLGQMSKKFNLKEGTAMNNDNEALVIIEEGTDLDGPVYYQCCWSVFMIVAW
jgi:hypothetical protein